MKKNFTLLSFLSLTLLFSGCMRTRYITEKYIKNNIEQHVEGKHSNIRTYSIFRGASYGGGSYLELTGYKYDSKKGLVIGADKYYQARQKFKGDQTVVAEYTYITLTLPQCKSILDNYKILLDKIKKEKVLTSEEVYHDFTVSEDLFISYRKSKGTSSIQYINLWVKGEKYLLSTGTLMQKLEKFMSY